MKKIIFIALAILTYTHITSADQKIVAVVDQDIITSNDLNNRYKVTIASNPEASKINKESLKAQLLQGLINEKIFLQEAKKLNIEPSKSDVESAIKNIENNRKMREGALLKELAAQGVPKEAFLHQIKTSLTWDRMLVEVIAGNIEVSNQELLSFISHNQPNKVHIDVYIASVDSSDGKAYKNLKKLWDNSKNCSAFKRAVERKDPDVRVENLTTSLSEISNLKTRTMISDLHKDQSSFIYEDHGRMNFIIVCEKKYDMSSKEMAYFDNVLREKKVAVQADYYMQNLKKKKFIEIYDLNG